MKSKFLAGASVLMMAMGASATVAHAQETPEAESGGLIDEVLVTARRTEERLQSVPVAVTALSTEDLEERGISDVADLQGAVPTLTFSNRAPTAGRKGLTFALRGLRSSAVPIYSSEIVRSSTSTADFYDLQAVEVSKGPQGTLFGSNSTGGAIVFRPQTPGEEFEASISARAGDYNMRGATAVVNYPLGDRAAVRLAVDGERRDGFVNSNFGPDLDSDTHAGGRLSVRLNPTDWLENLTVIEGYSFDSIGTYPFLRENRVGNFYGNNAEFLAAQPLGPFNLGTSQLGYVAGSPLPYVSFRSWSGANITDIDVGPILGDALGEISFRSVIGFVEEDQGALFDQDGTTAIVISQQSDANIQHYSWEPQIRGARNDGTLNWVIGAFYRESNTTAPSRTLVLPALCAFSLCRDIVGYSTATTENLAAYAQASWEFIDNVTFTAGYRWTQIDVVSNTTLI